MSASAPGHETPFVEYERRMEPARSRFAASPTLVALTSADIEPLLLELFLLYFASRGVRLSEPVEGWIRRAAQRCEDLGDVEVGRSLRGHAAAEGCRHLTMVRDTRALAARLNSRYALALDADRLLAAPPGPGATYYIAIHETVIVGSSPFAQVALEYEINLLPVRYGPKMVAASVARLGDDILGCLNFMTEHIKLDAAHTKFNSRLLRRLLARDSAVLPALLTAGTDILHAYGQFLTDCLQLAEAKRKEFG